MDELATFQEFKDGSLNIKLIKLESVPYNK